MACYCTNFQKKLRNDSTYPMKTVFELLTDIHYNKPDYALSKSDQFSAYMICRWISMVSPEYCVVINEIYNKKWDAFMDDQMIFDYLKLVLPKRKIYGTKYIKRSKPVTSKKTDDAIIKHIATMWQRTTDEVKNILQFYPEAIKDWEVDDLVLYKSKR